MNGVLEIERAIKQLPQEDYGKLRQRLEDYDLEQELGASSALVAGLLDDEDGGENQLLDE